MATKEQQRSMTERQSQQQQRQIQTQHQTTGRGGEPIEPTNVRTELDRLFDDFRSNFTDLFWPWTTGSQWMETMTPPIDVVDQGDRYEIKADMPGIPKDNINIDVTPTTIEISGNYEEREREGIEKKNFMRHERRMSFYRGLELPEEVKTENVNAEYKDGVLTIDLPKKEPKDMKTRKVQIK
jgi:HSP20 family protein